MQRRQFLQTSAALASTPFLSRPVFANAPQHYLDTIGLQLWTVRNQMQEDAAATIKTVADAGYKQVELMNVMDSADVVSLAKDNGMQVTSAFLDWQALGNPTNKNAPSADAILERAKSFGLRHLVFGYIGKGHRETADQFKGHAERANAFGEKCQAAGIQLCYHHHSFEFKPLADGKTTGFDVFVREFDPQLCKFEIDVFWVAIGGRNPMKVLRELKGRVSQVHLKDLLKGTKTIYDEGQVPHAAFEELGDGTINMSRVMQVAKKIGVEQCHVEQDQSPAPLKSIVQSLKHLKSQS